MAKGPLNKNFGSCLADPSPLAALLLLKIALLFLVVAPCQQGASAAKTPELLFRGP